MSIGENLVAARTARGLTIDDVSRVTRVRSTLVREIEADDYASCGGDVYARGHLRSIATAVGADPRALVAEFDRRHGVAVVAGVSRVAPRVIEPAAAARAERRGPNWPAAMIVALAVVSVLGLVTLVASPSSTDRSRDRAAVTGGNPGASGPAGGSKASPRATAPAPAPPAETLALVPLNGVAVRVRIIGDKSWVRVSNSANATLFQGVLQAGDLRDFQDASQLRLTLGNAGAVSLVVNGRDLGTVGAKGSVRRVVFGPGDPAGPAAG